jgi:hypothetical protein
MATDVLGTMRGYVTQLEAAGVRATIEPHDINPPAVLIRPPVLHYRFGRGCVAADWQARLYLPDPGTEGALQIALPLLDQITLALEGAAAITEATPADFQLADGSIAPGYQLSWSTH